MVRIDGLDLLRAELERLSPTDRARVVAMHRRVCARLRELDYVTVLP